MSHKISVWFGRAFLIAILSTVTLSASDCFAQIGGSRFQTLQQPGRFLGHGYSPGYHRCNPGPDPSYYNPYSAHNSFLVHKSPEYIARFGSRNNYGMQLNQYGSQGYGGGYGQTPYGQQGSSYGDIPHSTYSGASRQNVPFQTLPGQAVEATFVPAPSASDRAKEAEEDDDESDFEDIDESDIDDSDFGDDFDDAKYRRKDVDVDSQSSPSDDESGAFEELEKDFSMKLNGTRRQSLRQSNSESSIFLPASTGGR